MSAMEIDDIKEIKEDEKRNINHLLFSKSKSALRGHTNSFKVDGHGHNDLLEYINHIKATHKHIIENELATMTNVKFQIATQVTMNKPDDGYNILDEKGNEDKMIQTNFYSYCSLHSSEPKIKNNPLDKIFLMKLKY